MAKMWAGRTSGDTDTLCDDFNSSIHFDCRMFRQDIQGSIAHAAMMAKQGIITEQDKEELTEGLLDILADLESGKLEFDMSAEDIHMFVEQVLTERKGEVGKRLHTARSRNDQVALDIRLYLRSEIDGITALIRSLIKTVVDKAEEYKAAIMPGYTHLQRAQPVTFGHHMCAWCMMLMRDCGRIEDAVKRMNVSPLGSCALAGTTYNTDRKMEAAKLDGASKLKCIWHIQLPAILPTVVTMLILTLGSLFAVGTEKMLLLQTNLNMSKSEVIGTYVFKAGMNDAQYGFSTAVGLFQNLINITCMFVANFVSKKVADTSII